MQHSSLNARWPSWTPGCWLLGILVSLVLCSIPICAAYALDPAAMHSPGKITVQDGKLTAYIQGVSLRQVMEEVGRLGAAQVRWMDPDVGAQEVSIEFTDLPFPKAIRRILRGNNFILFYMPTRKGMKLTQIWISSGGEDGRQPVLKQQLAPQVKEIPISEEPAEDIAQPLDVVIQIATSDENPASRLSALRQLERYAQEDAMVRAILSRLAHTDSNPQVRDVASMVLTGIE